MRFAALGLIEFEPELIVSGINHGANLGDDITYSGTVAAALEGVVLGVPAIAVSQQSKKREMDFRFGREFDFEAVASFTARLVARLDEQPDAGRDAAERQLPGARPASCSGAEVTRLGKRIYRDKLELQEEAEDGDVRRRRYRIYGDDPSYHHEDGTDFAAIKAEKISVTPLHFELTDVEQHGGASGWDLRAWWLGHAPCRGDDRRGEEATPPRAELRAKLWSTTTTATTCSTIRRSRIRSTTTCCAS